MFHRKSITITVGKVLHLTYLHSSGWLLFLGILIILLCIYLNQPNNLFSMGEVGPSQSKVDSLWETVKRSLVSACLWEESREVDYGILTIWKAFNHILSIYWQESARVDLSWNLLVTSEFFKLVWLNIIRKSTNACSIQTESGNFDLGEKIICGYPTKLTDNAYSLEFLEDHEARSNPYRSHFILIREPKPHAYSRKVLHLFCTSNRRKPNKMLI